VIDSVIAPRVMVAPPAPRIALPLIQTRRPAGAAIVLPVVLSRPGRFNPGFAPARLGPARLGPAHINGVTATPGQFQRPGPGPLSGSQHPNLATTTPGQNGLPQNKLTNPNAPFHSNAINGPQGPVANPQAHMTGPLGQSHPNTFNGTQHMPSQAQSVVRPVNPQFRPPPQHPQITANPKPAPVRCAGKGCKR
jgi:hypothetical protein